jgi:hypothetical protein
VPPPTDDAVVATEQWFVGRGLPHFIFRYSASRDVWTRAAPLLALVALVEVVANAPSNDFAVWVSVLVSIAAFAAVVGVWAVANRLRGRPTFARPVDVGPIEVAMFVLVPALVPVAAGGQWRSGTVTAVANLALLALIYIVTSYGIVPMTRWAVVHGARQIRSVSGVLTRALPILLLVVIVVFYTQEPFQIAHDLPWALIGLAIGLFLVVGVAFAVIRIPRQVGELAEFESWATLRNRAAETPAAALVHGMPARPEPPPKLSKKEWLNVGLVVLATEGILIALVGAAMFGFLVVLGVITIPGSLMPLWVDGAPDVLWSFYLFDTRLVVTSELLKASAFLAGFTALQFTVSLLSDDSYQEEFLHELREQLRESLAARAVYLAFSIEASIRRARPSA